MKIRYDVLMKDFTSLDKKKKIKISEWTVDRKANGNYTIKLPSGLIIVLMKKKIDVNNIKME